MATEPLLAALPNGDVLELRPGGSWIAANVAALEKLLDAIAPDLDRAGFVKVDMAEVRELDTLGAWLLEKIIRRATLAGHRAETFGISDQYAGLIDEVRQVNRHNPKPAPAQNPVVAKLDDLGRSASNAMQDVADFLQMLGALAWRSLVRCAGRDRCG